MLKCGSRRLCGLAMILFGALSACADATDAERRAETARLQGLIDAAFAQGGGRVVVDAGEHPCGTLYLKSGVELHLAEGAVLSGGERPEDYDDAIPVGEVYSYAGAVPATVTRKAFIYAENATNIAITGTGVINGHGQAFFNQTTWAKPTILRPRMVVFMHCADIRFEDATFKDSPVWTMWLRHCDNIVASRITIDNDQRMINSDGIDFDACRHVRVGDSSFSAGDDCLILRAIRHASDAGHDVVTEDVVVSNCTLSTTCQGVRIACASDDIIRDAVFRDITFTGNNAIYAAQEYRYLEEGNSGRIRTSNLVFENWTITCSGWPVNVSIENGVTLSDFGHMSFSNLVIHAKKPIRIAGNGTSIVKDIQLTDVTGEITSGSETLSTNRVENLRLKNISLSASEASPKGKEVEIADGVVTQTGDHLYVGGASNDRGHVLRITRATLDYRTRNGIGDIIVGRENDAVDNRIVLTQGTLKYDRRWIGVGQVGSAQGNELELLEGSTLQAANAQLQIGYRARGCRMVLADGSSANVSLFALRNGATLSVRGAGNRLQIGQEGVEVEDGCAFQFTPPASPSDKPLLQVNRSLDFSANRPLVLDLGGQKAGRFAVLESAEALPAVSDGASVVFRNVPSGLRAHASRSEDGRTVYCVLEASGSLMRMK